MRRIVREATAYHEAGHAVAAWHICRKFKKVTIKPETNSLGHMQHDRAPKWFNPELDSSDRVRIRAERHIIVSMAGQISEAKFRGRRPRYGMHGDNQNAAELAFYFCSSEKTAQAYLDFCYSASQDLVDVRWPEITSLAAALLERETLSYEEALEVISPGSTALRQSLKTEKAKKGA